MADSNAFAKEFVDLLKRTEFPAGLRATDVLQQTHTVVYALVTKLLGQVGQQLTIADLAAQGPRGGGGPHRLDLVVHYLLAVDDKTMKTTTTSLEGGA
jgi:hypothetical protein